MGIASLRRVVVLAGVMAVAAVPAAAHGASFQTYSDLASGTQGIATGADGDVYVVETTAARVTVLTPDGGLVRRVTLPAASRPTSATLGPDGNVWVALSAATATRGLARIAPDGTLTLFPTTALYACGPAGLASDTVSGRVLFSAPDGGTSCGTHGIGFVKEGSGGQGGTTTLDSYDLAVLDGSVYAPLTTGDVIERRSLATFGISPSANAQWTLPTGSIAEDIAVGADRGLWVTLVGVGKVARLDPAAPSGSAVPIVATGLNGPLGIVAHPDGGMYVASSGDARLLRIDQTTLAQRSIALPAGYHPWEIAVAGEDLWVTDPVTAHVLRVVDGAPRVGATDTALGLRTTVDPRGNDTAVTLEAVPADPTWPTVTAAAPTIPAGIGAQPVVMSPIGQAGGRYTVTFVAANARGTVRGPSVSYVNPPPPASVVPSVDTGLPNPPAAAKAPKVADLLSGVTQRTCLSRRSFTVRLRHPKGVTVTRVQVKVGSRRTASYTGRRLKAAVELTGLPKGTFTVRFTIRLKDGRTVRQTRTYRTCGARPTR